MIMKRKALFVMAILMIVGTSVGFIIKADAKSIHLNKTKAAMQVGDTVKLKVSGGVKVKWSSSAPKVCTVTKK
ncbi:MAG: hypothetical protein IJ815_01785 [Lachnospiraceae bacterium]|nr:hypothetical protein [Lachnospiraceae bacterium]